MPLESMCAICFADNRPGGRNPVEKIAAAEKEPAQRIAPVNQGRGGLKIRRVFS
ncbi:hypothetical protein [Paraburkholderia fungorum]|uniref:hypothetical protein n=1 Tax=Paraburkholderia fungorum TaxID=134537 RepID=UPI0014962282|nr:hypothetical protein [Paraburkholderia fungorum]